MDFKNLKQEYEKKGFIVLRNLISKKNLSEINHSLKIFAQRYSPKNKKNLNMTKNLKINSIHNMEHWGWIRKLRKNKVINTVVKTLIAEKTKNFGSELFAKPAKHGLKSPVHQDNYYWSINNNKGLTVWISLNRSEKKNGGVFYFKGSHKIGLLNHVPSHAPGSSQTVSNLNRLKKFKKVYPKLKPGDCLVHNVMIAHGSESNKSNLPRKGVTLRYIPKKSKFNKLQKKKYEQSLKKQILIREQNARF